MAATPKGILAEIKRDIMRREGLTADSRYTPTIRNKSESNEHGYMHNALATLCYESSGIDLINYTFQRKYFEGSGYYLEAYASYLIGVYRV